MLGEDRQKISKRRISWNFLLPSRFCSLLNLFSTRLYFSILKNEIQAVLFPKVHSTMRAMHDSELWKFQQCCLKVIPASYFCIITPVDLDGDNTDITVWAGSPELLSLTALKFFAVLSWLRLQILERMMQNSGSTAVLVRERCGNTHLPCAPIPLLLGMPTSSVWIGEINTFCPAAVNFLHSVLNS